MPDLSGNRSIAALMLTLIAAISTASSRSHGATGSGPESKPATGIWVNCKVKVSGDGSRKKPFRTIQEAAQVARPGDTVRVLPGVYRERVMPQRGGEKGKPITYVSVKRHQAIVKGSDVFKPEWKKEKGILYSAAINDSMFTDTAYIDGGNPYKIPHVWAKGYCPYPQKSIKWTIGQLFMDGERLQQTSSRDELSKTPNAWWYDPASNRIVLNCGGKSPSRHAIEITTRRGVFRPLKRNLGYIEVRGFIFEHCANQVPSAFWNNMKNNQSGMVGTRSGHHWVIADNIIRHANSIGLTFGGPSGNRPLFDNETPPQPEKRVAVAGYHQIEGNVFDRNGALGAMGNNTHHVVFRRNLFTRNNALANTVLETGAIKTHLAFDMIVEQNWFIDNDSMGVWLDNTWKRCRITRNVFLGNRDKDVFLEMDDNKMDTAALVDNNIFLPGRPRFGRNPIMECGIYGHDADGAIIVNNLFAGKGVGVYFRSCSSTRKGNASNVIANANIFCDSLKTTVNLPIHYPPRITGNKFDGNVYPTSSRFQITGLVKGWSPEKEAIKKINRLLPAGKPATYDIKKVDDGFRVNMAGWRDVMKFDTKSVNANVRCSFDRKRNVLRLAIPQSIAKFTVKRHPKLRRDFFGQELADKTATGPFAKLRNGTQQIKIKPPVTYKARITNSSNSTTGLGGVR
ncbi:MAG: hypothetical protein GY794_04630 [bacterium]|nr:hypothetical protein [bacterium]